MVLKILSAALVALVVLIPPALAQNSQQFVSVIDDLPLMVGLSELGEGVEFATPQGRIAETTATGAVSRKSVQDFYARTLPQLGWKAVDSTRFKREGETLDLVLGNDGGVLTVRFSLAPSE